MQLKKQQNGKLLRANKVSVEKPNIFSVRIYHQLMHSLLCCAVVLQETRIPEVLTKTAADETFSGMVDFSRRFSSSSALRC